MKKPCLMTSPPVKAAVLLLISATGFAANDVSTLYEEAVSHYNQSQFGTARIQLKNALQHNPEHLPSRLLIGRLYMRTGNLAAAEKELRLALKMGAARDQVYRYLGNALLAQKKYEALLEIMPVLRTQTLQAGQVLVFRGRAYLELGLYDNALQSFEAAAEIAPDDIEVLLGISAVHIARGRLYEAKALIERAGKLAPDNYAIWYQDGLLREALKDYSGALPSYNRALMLNPLSQKTLVARATLYLRTGQDEKARQDLEVVYTESPHDLNAALIYSQALTRLNQKDKAKKVLQTMTIQLGRINEKVILSEPLLLRIATLIKYISKDFEQAQRFAERYIALKPDSSEIIKLLATIKLRKRQYDAVISLLIPLQRSRPDDAETLALLSEAQLRKGKYVQASDTLKKAVAIAPDNALLNTRLGLSHIGMGLPDSGMADLERAFRQNSVTAISAGVILTQILLRKGDLQKALDIASQLTTRQPKNPILYNLLGAVHLSIGDYEQARAAFTQASGVAPDFQGAEYNLALLDIHQRNYKNARSRLNVLLEKYEESTLVFAAFSYLELAEGSTDKAIPWLVKATVRDDATAQSMATLVDLYIETGDKDKALEVAKKLYARHPNARDTRPTLARAQISKGMQREAKYNLQRAIRNHDYPGESLLRIASLQTLLKDYDGARYTLIKASASDRASDGNAALIRLDIITDDLDSAHQRALEMSENPGTATQGQMFIGDIRFRQKEYEPSLTAYQVSFESNPSSQAARGIFNATFSMGDRKQALDWLEVWLQEHPRDAASRRSLARTYLSLNKFGEAQKNYEQLLRDGHSDALIYSRLSRIYQLRRDPRARKTAEQALQMAPNSPTVLDTYGWILVTEGDVAKGLQYLREASSRDSDPMIRYHLASALSELDRDTEAIMELRSILRSKQKPPWFSSAQKLHDRLESRQQKAN